MTIQLGDTTLAELVALITDPAGLLGALQNQKQIDMDGSEVGVSRQAVDEAIAIVAAFPAISAKLEAAERLRDEAVSCGDRDTFALNKAVAAFDQAGKK